MAALQGEDELHGTHHGGVLYQHRICALGKEPGEYSSDFIGILSLREAAQGPAGKIYLHGAFRNLSVALGDGDGVHAAVSLGRESSDSGGNGHIDRLCTAVFVHAHCLHAYGLQSV